MLGDRAVCFTGVLSRPFTLGDKATMVVEIVAVHGVEGLVERFVGGVGLVGRRLRGLLVRLVAHLSFFLGGGGVQSAAGRQPASQACLAQPLRSSGLKL